jgi:hypothetical protein
MTFMTGNNFRNMNLEVEELILPSLFRKNIKENVTAVYQSLTFASHFVELAFARNYL